MVALLAQLLAVATNDIRESCADRAFQLVHMGFLLTMAAVVAVSWPADLPRTLHPPPIGVVFAHGLAIGGAYLGLFLYDGRLRLERVVSVDVWAASGGLGRAQVVCGKALALTVIMATIFFSTLPLAVLVIAVGGLTANGLVEAYQLAFCIAIAFALTSMVIREAVPQAALIPLTLFVVYCFGLMVYNPQASPETFLYRPLHLWPLYASGALVVLFMFSQRRCLG